MTSGSAPCSDSAAQRLDELVAVLPPKSVVIDVDLLEKYRYDCARDPDGSVPTAVVRARSTADVQATLRWAGEHRVPVVPRGAGSSLSGGSTGLAGGITLSTERMREITIDPAARVAIAQPGALNAEVKAAAAEHGLWYPPDPSSSEISSIGGNAATNAGGLCCVKYGVTADYVLGMQVVLADGTAVRLGGQWLKNAAGLSLTKLFVGSEGTLGIITELTLRLLPAPPPEHTLVAMFDTIDAAARAVVTITARVRPSMLELMDRSSVNAVEDKLRMGLNRNAGALLLARSDAPAGAAGTEMELLRAACEEQGAHDIFTTDDPDEGAAFCEARRAAVPAMEAFGTLLLEDVGVPVAKLPALVLGIEQIAAARDTRIFLIAHAGDGNTHPVIAYDPTSTAAEQRARQAFGEVMDLALRLGGTITGEHGVGRLKAAWLPDQLGSDAMELTRRIKDALDPASILNPGVMLPTPNSPA
ncbi:FAD-binding oxidoreductase [Streptomyces sp. NPDC102441]|uniref:FAD-binding oxidoreductase n=1 Tax=Streptomyces sp. NPDC102441 TaxID=3366176 RepID=UPI003806C026